MHSHLGSGRASITPTVWTHTIVQRSLFWFYASTQRSVWSLPRQFRCCPNTVPFLSPCEIESCDTIGIWRHVVWVWVVYVSVAYGVWAHHIAMGRPYPETMSLSHQLESVVVVVPNLFWSTGGHCWLGFFSVSVSFVYFDTDVWPVCFYLISYCIYIYHILDLTQTTYYFQHGLVEYVLKSYPFVRSAP